MSEHLNSYQSVYLANLDDTTDFLTMENSKKIEFYCDFEQADTKTFAYLNFLSNAVQLKRFIIDSEDIWVTLVSLS